MATRDVSIGNTYQIPKVILSPIMDDQAGTYDQSLEPPYVRVRTGNVAFTFLDNFNATSRLSSTSFIIPSTGGILTKRTKRIAISYYQSDLPFTNINPRNNVVNFTTAGGPFSATIPEGFYTRTQAIAALLTALNGAGSGVTFTMPGQFPNSDVYSVLTGTGNFVITGGSFYTHGHGFWGFQQTDTRLGPSATLSTNTLTLGPISALYTRYYDFCSYNLLQHTKAANIGVDAPANTVFRIYCGTPLTDPINFTIAFEQGASNSSWNYDATHSLYGIDIQIYDEFKEPLYLPNGNLNAGTFQVAFTNEI
jgi:hypothetical protein